MASACASARAPARSSRRLTSASSSAAAAPSTLKRADLGIALFQVLAAPRDGDVQDRRPCRRCSNRGDRPRSSTPPAGSVEVDGASIARTLRVTLTLPRKMRETFSILYNNSGISMQAIQSIATLLSSRREIKYSLPSNPNHDDLTAAVITSAG